MINTVLEEYQRIVRTASPRPTTWCDVIGNETAVELIREAIQAANIQSQQMAHTLLFGPPGMGKTTMSKLVAAEIGSGFVETTASTLETPADMVRILDQLNLEKERTGKPSVLFIDECHMIGAAKGRLAIDQESIFPLLEDWFFPHNLLGKHFTRFDGQDRVLTGNTFLVWPFTCVGATTEPGLLSTALLRRFLIHIELQPYTEEDIARIMDGSAQRMGWELEDGASTELAKYARRNPGRAYQLLTSARNRAIATTRSIISLDVVAEILERMRLYPQGLTDTDVRILQILADRAPKGVGMAELCRAAGISQSQFSGMLEPYLRLLGFVETLSRRVITNRGLVYLAQLDRVDQTRPEVRAAVAAARTS